MLPTLAALVLSAAPSFPEQLMSARLVVELSVSITQPNARQVKRVLLPEGTQAPADLPLPKLGVSGCKVGASIEYVVPYVQDAKGHWKALPVARQAKGRGTSCEPGYPKLVAALLEAGQWREERMRAVGAEQLWQPERKALHADDAWRRALAWQFLLTHGAAEVLDAEWGAPTTPARAAEEAKSAP